MTLQSATLPPGIRSANQVPPPGSPAADQKRNEFIAAVLDICGDVRAFWLPGMGDTTTTTGVGRDARTYTYDATIASRISPLGSGVQVDFDGTDDEADTPDAANLSYGDSLVDEPFSILWLGSPAANNANYALLTKQDSASVDEWRFGINGSGYFFLELIDASTSANISRRYDTVVGTSDVFLAATYDGSRAEPGINLYLNAVVVDDGTFSSGTYTAMENTAALLRVGCRYTTPAQFYDGQMAYAIVVAKEMSREELWAIKELGNGFYDLAL